MKSYSCGVDVGNKKVCILLHADDVFIWASNENELQTLLNALGTWWDHNCMSINSTKCSVVQFRNSIIHYANYYTYLGLVLNEFLDYSITATVVDTSANRALGLVIDKCKLLSGIAYLVILCIYKIIW